MLPGHLNNAPPAELPGDSFLARYQRRAAVWVGRGLIRGNSCNICMRGDVRVRNYVLGS